MDEEQRKLAEELLSSGVKYPSFAKQFFFGLFDSSQVFPYPKDKSENEEKSKTLLRDLKAFLEKEVDPVAIDRNAEIPKSVVEGLGKLGVFAATVPKEWNGLNLSQTTYCKATEMIAGRCASTALFVNVQQSIGLKAFLLFGNEAQRKAWLPLLATGERLAAFSLTEPNAGSDAAGIETRAEFIPEKNVYRINGRKQWTTNGGIADVLTVMAKMQVDTPKGKEEKITAFLVTPKMAGFKVLNPSLEKVGMRGTKTANLQFTDMEVPAENILGPVGGGLKVCLSILDFGRTTFGSTCTGTAKFLLEKACYHAVNRIQFKRPLATFGMVKEKLARMAALVYAMDATTYLTAGLIDEGEEDIMLESAMLKVFTSEAAWSILYDTMQIYGGRSFFTDQPFERIMRDSRLNMIGEGANEVMRVFIGAVGLRDVGMQLKGVADALKNPIKDFSKISAFIKLRLKALRTPKIPVKSALLYKEADLLGKAIRRFGIANLKLLAKYREEIVEKQLLLNRLADAAMAIYTASAVLSKADSALTAGKAEKDELATAKLYCTMALETIDKSLKGLSCNNDDAFEQLSDQLTGLKRV